MKTYKAAALLSVLVSALSCSYLNVVPPEQPDTNDMMVDEATTLNMLYSCYSYAQENISMPMFRNADMGGTDEAVGPQEWESMGSRVQWDAITPSSINGDNMYPWKVWYNGIGYCNLFLKLMKEHDPAMNPNDKAQYIAEVKFLKAYYHFRLLQMYGPIPVVDSFISSNTLKQDFPGRSHFDYCVDYIANLFDEAAEYLPARHSNQAYYGRATSIMCKALKARLLVLAASPLWNGDFPNPAWKNKSYETPGYGLLLVSQTRDENKWERARTACQEAIEAAENSGHELFNIESSELLRENNSIGLPDIPALGESEDDIAFKKTVVMLRYLMATSPQDGNKEIIWGLVPMNGGIDNHTTAMASIPHFVMKNELGQNIGGWGGLSPTLFTVSHFFTKDGLLPEDDPGFVSESEYFTSAGLSNPDITRINVGREPRYYAAIGFDGDQYSTKIAGGSPLYLEMRNNTKTGYDANIWGTRNYSVTGFLNKKWVNPNFYYTGIGWSHSLPKTPLSLIRLGEMYLEMAECEAQCGNDAEALVWLNKIRSRAGVPEWTLSSLSDNGKSVLEAVMDERFAECYLEGYRYYDIRRYLLGSDTMSKVNYKGLDAIRKSPGFTTFNTVVSISQPFEWNDRMYLLPVSNDEVYSNPNLVQAPGY